jgi:hypothetical protein
MLLRALKRSSLAFAAMLVARVAHADGPAALDACFSASEKAQLARDEGHYLLARQLFSKCAQESCPTPVRNDCTKAAVDVASTQPSIVFGVQDERGRDLRDVTISVDGEPLVAQVDGRPVEVDPGSHVFAFSSAQYSTKTVSLVVRAGEKNRLVTVQVERPQKTDHAAPPDSQPARPVPVLSLVLAGVGIVAIGAGAFVALGARSDLSDLESAPCASTRTCEESDVDSVRTRLVVGDAFFATGAVAIGVAAVLWLTSR